MDGEQTRYDRELQRVTSFLSFFSLHHGGNATTS